MPTPPTLRLGNVVVTSLNGRRFIFQDAQNPQNTLMVEDADLVDLIVFLHQHSARAARAMNIEVPPGDRPQTENDS
jgi:hypothetical protein